MLPVKCLNYTLLCKLQISLKFIQLPVVSVHSSINITALTSTNNHILREMKAAVKYEVHHVFFH